jgi:hypothetical protein
MTIRNIQKNKGFVLLFAVSISAILLAIALGAANISLKELQFSTSAKDTNDAFFAADAGTECALYYDRSDQNKFPLGGPAPAPISCGSGNITVGFSAGTYSFTVIGLGSAGTSCSKVTVSKAIIAPFTTIISKGYNVGNTSGTCTPLPSNAVEREIKTTF